MASNSNSNYEAKRGLLKSPQVQKQTSNSNLCSIKTGNGIKSQNSYNTYNSNFVTETFDLSFGSNSRIYTDNSSSSSSRGRSYDMKSYSNMCATNPCAPKSSQSYSFFRGQKSLIDNSSIPDLSDFDSKTVYPSNMCVTNPCAPKSSQSYSFFRGQKSLIDDSSIPDLSDFDSKTVYPSNMCVTGPCAPKSSQSYSYFGGQKNPIYNSNFVPVKGSVDSFISDIVNDKIYSISDDDFIF